MVILKYHRVLDGMPHDGLKLMSVRSESDSHKSYGWNGLPFQLSKLDVNFWVFGFLQHSITYLLDISERITIVM